MPKKEQKRLVLLDMHAILHRAFHALPAFSSPQGEPTGALYGFVAFLLKVLRELKPDYIAAAYDLPEPTFRHAAYEKYKIQRPEMASDLSQQVRRSYDFLKAFSIPIFEHPRFEADDIVGTLAEKAKKQKGLEIIIASGDLDTLQLVKNSKIKVFTLKKGIQDTIIYDETKVFERFGFAPKLLADFKGLRGDPSDNIPGVPGIGDKGATELIKKFGGLENIFKVLKQDKKALLKAGIKERAVKLLEEHQEEAFFSKELGSIRKDVPLEFDLEKLGWQRDYDKEKASLLFKELGFMSLLSRLPDSGEAKEETKEEKIEISEEEDILKKEKIIFWHEAGGKLYAVTEDKKIVSVKEFSEGERENYFFDAKNIFHKFVSAGPLPRIKFDLKIAAWLSRPTLQNPNLEALIHNFLPREVLEKGELSKALALLPDLRGVLETELSEKKLNRVWEEIELPLIPVLFQMEERGILVDSPLLKKLSQGYEKKLSQLQEKIWKMVDTHFNLNSPRQLSEVLFEKLKLEVKGLKKTEKGSRSTRESELLKLRGAHPVIEKILSYRELFKIKSTYLDTLPNLLDKEGRAHTTFDQTGTVTGRLSSFEPNLQNIPIRSEAGREIRKAFLASPGFTLVAFDYSQLELRIAAILSGDEKMRKAFREGKDIHTATAAEIFNVAESGVTPEMRSRAKVINFGVLYGMGAKALSGSMGVSLDEARDFIEEYFRDFEGVAAFIEKIKDEARRDGWVQTLFGRKRYLPQIYSEAEYIRGEAERMAVNAPIQGSEADVVKLGMIRSQDLIEKKFKGQAFQLLQIHDELLFEVKKELVPEFVFEIKKILEEIYPHEIKLEVQAKTGPSWGELEEYAMVGKGK